MAKSKKNMTFDGMVKFFLQYYKIPTRKDIEKLMKRMDQIETLIKNKWMDAGKSRAGLGQAINAGMDKKNMTASDEVLQVITEAGPEGASFAEIKDKTEFADKKLRNIIFRLNKLEKITRVSRGIYAAS